MNGHSLLTFACRISTAKDNTHLSVTEVKLSGQDKTSIKNSAASAIKHPLKILVGNLYEKLCKQGR